MGEPEWTGQQLNAIESRGGTLLVSAAAGSGKTAVLVERLTRMIADENNPCSVGNILVVTFTNAAAANMKTKIAQSLSKAIKKDPGNPRLRSEMNLLPFAKISTIDTFCINLVRDNFHELDISPDFRIIDDGRKAVLQNDALNTVLDNYSALAPEGYDRMIELVCDEKDDSKVAEAIINIYKKVQAYPFPDERLDYFLNLYKNDIPFEETVWGKTVYAFTEKVLRHCKTQLEKAMLLSEKNKGEKEEPPQLKQDHDNYCEILEMLPTAGWEELCEKISHVSFADWQGKKHPDAAYLKALRDGAKKDSFQYLTDTKALFKETREQIKEDIDDIRPALGCLVAMVRDFEKEYTNLKRKENYADFNDTLHYAIKLLCKKDENGGIVKDENGNPVAGPLAKELADGFSEILVDEYQDVNEAQELLFRLVSKDGGNMFMVGDVKQSIYGFREAMPELFLEKQKTFAKYDGVTYPSTVVLGRNFRSRSGVTENINHIFSRVMTEGIGGLEYNEDHYLNYNKDSYTEHNEPDTELHFVSNNDDKTEAEIRYIADYIEQNAGVRVIKDGDTLRPAQFGDFAVLLRSFSDYPSRLSEELTSRGIPVVINADREFFDAPEVRFMLALLRTVANPLDDVSLLAVMLSPVYGFTPDDAAQIRIGQRGKKLFYAVQKAANAGDEKSKHLLDEIERLKNISYTVGAEQFVHILLDETGYFSVVSVMPDAPARTENLKQLCDYAAEYESSGRVGLSGFLRYIERAESTEVKAKTGEAEGSNAVKIMTIHKSKGLEFPVCILANCGKEFNKKEDNIMFARRCGIGMYSGGKDFVRFGNIIRTATCLEAAEAHMAEELRVLYVALTRAKEKLLIVATYSAEPKAKNQSKKPFKLIDLADNEKISPFAVLRAGHSIDIIASALINHADAVHLREMDTGLVDSSYIELDAANEANLKIVDTPYEISPEEETAEEQPEEDLSPLLRKIALRAEYVYPHSDLNGKAVKKVASDFAAAHERGEFTAMTVPSFMGKDELSAAQKGTATHKFMQFCSFETKDVRGELERVVGEGLMSQKEADAVDTDKIAAFLSCDLVARIGASPAVYREQCFTCGLKAGEVYPELRGEDAEETVIVDGIADLAFDEDGKLVIVDYKTDGRVTPEILRERYSGQLSVYARCLSELLNKEVKETLIYSFSLGETVEISQ